MAEFGVPSDVGKRRKVIVHRPEPGRKRLIPSNHCDLRFDDVLWVERTTWQRDPCVAVRRACASARGGSDLPGRPDRGLRAEPADAMMPEAFQHGGKLAGISTVLGFLVAAALSVAQ
jgi:hypothetical protein